MHAPQACEIISNAILKKIWTVCLESEAYYTSLVLKMLAKLGEGMAPQLSAGFRSGGCSGRLGFSEISKKIIMMS
jgi:hypothetical protein